MIFNVEYGMFNCFLELIGLEFLRQNWLGDPDLAMFAVCVVIIWQFVGLYFIIFMSALQTVPNDILEAAELDGANEWQKTWYVTLPSIWNVILVSIVLCISGSLKTFDLIFVMTSGGPANATEVMATYMYTETFRGLRYGYGSAISVLIFVFSIGMISLCTKWLGRRGDRKAVCAMDAAYSPSRIDDRFSRKARAKKRIGRVIVYAVLIGFAW